MAGQGCGRAGRWRGRVLGKALCDEALSWLAPFCWRWGLGWGRGWAAGGEVVRQCGHCPLLACVTGVGGDREVRAGISGSISLFLSG